jgi:hypothetical protein
MNEIEKYLDEVCRTLGGSHDLREHVREELREHLEEAVEAHVAKGLSRDEAVRKAIDEFGRPEDVGKDLEGVYGRRMMSLAIDKAMDWKARTLKSGWKWSFLASLAIFAIIIAQVGLILGFLVFITPWNQETYAVLGRPLPRYYDAMIQAARFIRHGRLGWTVIGLFIAAWALFEWRSKSESKPLIRLGIGALLALLTTAATWWVAAATVVPMVRAIPLIESQDLRPGTATAIRDARAALAEIQKSIAAKDYDSAYEAVLSLNGAVGSFRWKPSAVATLLAMNRSEDFEKVKQASNELTDGSMRLMRTLSAHPGDAQRDFDALSGSWDAFCKEAQCESTDSMTLAPDGKK